MPSLNELMRSAFGGQGTATPPQAPAQMAQAPLGPSALGNGMAAEAAKIIQSRPYQLHVQEAKAMGAPPMSPQEFLQKMQGAQGQQAPQQLPLQ